MSFLSTYWYHRFIFKNKDFWRGYFCIFLRFWEPSKLRCSKKLRRIKLCHVPNFFILTKWKHHIRNAFAINISLVKVFQTQFILLIFASTKKHKRMFGNNKYLFPFVFSTAMSYNNFNISNAIWTIEISSVFTVDVPNIASLVFFLISILQYLKIDFVYFACKWLLVS